MTDVSAPQPTPPQAYDTLEIRLQPVQAAPLPAGDTVLVLAPHPDDEVFGCGGTLARLVQAGRRVLVDLLTTGARADQPDNVQITAARLAESTAAAAAIGYPPPHVVGWADRSLRYDEPLIEQLHQRLDRLRPDVVFAPSASEMHPDHRMLAMALVEALRRYDGDASVYFYEVGVPLRPNCLIDISAAMPHKRTAMRCFASQLEAQPYDQQVEALNRFRSYALPGVEFAEAFYQVNAAQLRADPQAALAPEYFAQRALGLPMLPDDLPLVSVLVRSSDRATLNEALASVAAQTYPHIEIVVLNVGGRPHAPLSASYGGRPLRFIDPGHPLGRAAACEALRQACKPGYALFLDDDDWLLPDHIMRLASALGADRQLAAAYADVECRRQEADGSWSVVRAYATDYERARLRVENFLPIHAVLFRTERAQTLAFDTAFDLFEDWDWWLQLSGQGPFHRVPGVSAIYRIHAAGGLGVAADQGMAAQALAQIVRKWQVGADESAQTEALAHTRRVMRALEDAQAALTESGQARLTADRAHGEQLEALQAEHGAEVARLLRGQEHHETEIARLNAAILAQQRQAADQLLHTIALFEGSLSWRLTAPLRKVSSKLKSGKRKLANGSLGAAKRVYRAAPANWLLSRLPYTLKRDVRNFLLRHSHEPMAAVEGRTEAQAANGRVSIVIPVYNHAAYLRRCIDSAIAQTWPDTEVVIVDDCSPDPEVARILDAYRAHPRVKLLRNERNMGISLTQNHALMAATGSVIGFLDCDDYLMPEAVATCMAAWQADTVYSHSGRINVDEQDKELSRIHFMELPRQDYFSENLAAMYATHFKMIRRDAFGRVGLFDPRFDSAQDYDMLMRIAFHYPSSAFVHVPDFVYCHRMHPRQTTEVQNAKQQWCTDTIQREARLRRDIRQGRFDRKLSIIMLSFGKRTQTIEALRSIKRTVAIPHEIVLYDNGSAPETVEYLKTHIDGQFDGLKVYYGDRNLGPAGGRRKALEYATGDWFLIFDNDELAEPGWIEEMLVRAKSDEKIGSVCARVVFPNQCLQFSGGQVEPVDHEVIKLSLFDNGKRFDDLSACEFRDVDWCPIGATLFTVNIAEHLHDGYPNTFEDAGVSFSLKRRGLRLVNTPAALVWHEHVNFRPKVDMHERYMSDRYNPKLMLKSVASFYKENGLVIYDEYIWRENQLTHAPREVRMQKIAEAGQRETVF